MSSRTTISRLANGLSKINAAMEGSRCPCLGMIENDPENSPILKPLEVNLVLLKMHPLFLETPKDCRIQGFFVEVFTLSEHRCSYGSAYIVE